MRRSAQPRVPCCRREVFYAWRARCQRQDAATLFAVRRFTQAVAAHNIYAAAPPASGSRAQVASTATQVLPVADAACLLPPSSPLTRAAQRVQRAQVQRGEDGQRRQAPRREAAAPAGSDARIVQPGAGKR